MCIAILKRSYTKTFHLAVAIRKQLCLCRFFFMIPLHSVWHLLGEVFLQKENRPLVCWCFLLLLPFTNKRKEWSSCLFCASTHFSRAVKKAQPWAGGYPMAQPIQPQRSVAVMVQVRPIVANSSCKDSYFSYLLPQTWLSSFSPKQHLSWNYAKVHCINITIFINFFLVLCLDTAWLFSTLYWRVSSWFTSVFVHKHVTILLQDHTINWVEKDLWDDRVLWRDRM